MTRDINTKIPGDVQVECVTCHRGVPKAASTLGLEGEADGAPRPRLQLHQVCRDLQNVLGVAGNHVRSGHARLEAEWRALNRRRQARGRHVDRDGPQTPGPGHDGGHGRGDGLRRVGDDVDVVRPVLAVHAAKLPEVARAQADRDKTHGKLANDNFVRNAPEAVVAAERQRLAELEQTVASLASQLERVRELLPPGSV